MKLSQMAVAIDHHLAVNLRTQMCKLPSFTHPDSAMLELDRATLARSLKSTPSSVFPRSSSTPCMSVATKRDEELENHARVEIVAGRGASGVRALVLEATIAMAPGLDLVSAFGGLGSTYFLRNRCGESIAVVKPIEEEPLASLSDPIGFAGRILTPSGMNHSVQLGETGAREVAAYLLDHNGFAGVPPTVLVKISHVAFNEKCSTMLSKIASLQRFVPHEYDAGDLGPSSFTVASVHRIGILDVRLLNIDRHAGNILVKKHGLGMEGAYSINDICGVGGTDLVPIDHGLCLPESLDNPYFEWLHWPQASVPFSDYELEYISALNPLKDADLLRNELPLLKESSIRVHVICTIFLKRAADAGLSLADIGDMMTREFRGIEEEPSVLETLCTQAKATMMITFDNGVEGEGDQFEFDADFEDIHNNNNGGDALDLPRLLQSHPQMSKPPKTPVLARTISALPHAALSTLSEEDDDHNDGNNGNEDSNDNDNNNDDGEPKAGGLTKSLSISVMKYNRECGEISFKGMSEKDWELFLERFELVLPEAFELRKSMGLKQRLGTSCKF